MSNVNSDLIKLNNEAIITKEFILENEKEIDFSLLSILVDLSEEIIDAFADKLNWISVSIFQKMSCEFMAKHYDKIDWLMISGTQKLSEKFMDTFADKLDWQQMSQTQEITPYLMKKYGIKLNWVAILKRYPNLPKEILEENKLWIKISYDTEERMKKKQKKG